MRIESVTCHRQLQSFTDGPAVMSGVRVGLGLEVHIASLGEPILEVSR